MSGTTSGAALYSRQDRAAFAAFFRQEIAPGLGALERARANRLKTAYVRGLGSAAITAFAVMILAFLRTPLPVVMLLFTLLTLGVTITSENLIGAVPPGTRPGPLAAKLPNQPRARALALAAGIVIGVLTLWLCVWVMSKQGHHDLYHYRTALLIPIAGVLLGCFWVRAALRDYDARLRAFVIPALSRFLGDFTYVANPGETVDLRRLEEQGIVARYDRATFSFMLMGRYRDTAFRVVATHMAKEGDDSRPAFEGLLCEIAVPQTFTCKIVITISYSGLGKLGEIANNIQNYWHGTTRDLLPVDLHHAEFEERYRVFSDDPREARELLSRGFLRSLLDISEQFVPVPVPISLLRCAFLNGRFLIGLPINLEMFLCGAAHRSLHHAEEDLLRLAQAFTIPHRLIDNLHGERKPVLPQA